jgi:hypothetical protein
MPIEANMRDEKCKQNFDRKTCGEETTLKIQAYMGE